MRETIIFILVLAILLVTGKAFSAQGQWGGFIYLTPKSGNMIPADKKGNILQTLKMDIKSFGNDFDPKKGRIETIQFYKGYDYSQDGKSLMKNIPTILIKVESLEKAKIDSFFKKVSNALNKYFDMKYRFGVTRQLNYTDTKTLARLKDNAPKRSNGTDQPNAVIFPLSKTSEWWSLTSEKREQYFHKNTDMFGKNNLGHNEIGFKYIKRIYRKLYHSRFIDKQQDFVTYFEFADKDIDTFKSLLNGLRDKQINPEWKFVQEEPIFWGKRMMSLGEIL